MLNEYLVTGFTLNSSDEKESFAEKTMAKSPQQARNNIHYRLKLKPLYDVEIKRLSADSEIDLFENVIYNEQPIQQNGYANFKVWLDKKHKEAI